MAHSPSGDPGIAVVVGEAPAPLRGWNPNEEA